MNHLTIIVVIAGLIVMVASLYWFRAHRTRQQAKARGAWLTRELGRTDSQIGVLEIWSDEQLERNDRELANSILDKVGTQLSDDESVEALRLRAFLAKIRDNHAGSELKTPRELGVAWFACLQVQDREPASELAKLFKVLNDAWSATREGQPRLSDSDQRMALKTIATTLVHTGNPS